MRTNKDVLIRPPRLVGIQHLSTVVRNVVVRLLATRLLTRGWSVFGRRGSDEARILPHGKGCVEDQVVAAVARVKRKLPGHRVVGCVNSVDLCVFSTDALADGSRPTSKDMVVLRLRQIYFLG